MSKIFEKLFNFKVFRAGGTETKRKKLYHNIKDNQNPEDDWQIVQEIGDGAFGKVYKVTLGSVLSFDCNDGFLFLG